MSNLVAVYGSLRKGFGNHRLLEGCKQLGNHWVPGFEMFSLGAFPGIRKGHSHIFTEVYEVDDDTLKRLDLLEGYRGVEEMNFYNRIEVDTPYGDAKMYTLEGAQYQDNPVVEGGNWAFNKRKEVKLKDLI